MKFRPCIDLYQGKVTQLVGATLMLKDKLKINFIAKEDAHWFAKLYQSYKLKDGHIIRLGINNDKACISALKAYPYGFRIGGGITINNAEFWLNAGASAVILNSYIFEKKDISINKLAKVKKLIGKDKIVIDLSTAIDSRGERWIYLDGWNARSNQKLDSNLFNKLSAYCSGFLIHSIKQEGQSIGVDRGLIEILSWHNELPIVYAGGVSSLIDIEFIKSTGKGMIDFTVGSALDIFGGKGLIFKDLVKKFT